MLLPRVLSAIVMATLFVLAVFTFEKIPFTLFITVIVLLASWEWARLSGVASQLGRVSFALFIGVSCVATYYFELQQTFIYVSPIVWCFALYWVARYPIQLIWRYVVSRLLFGLFVFISTWSALFILKSGEGFVAWVLLLMGLIWGADSGAYFAGRAFGKRKLARYVSPGKSWEGVVGGLCLSQMIVAAFVFLNDFSYIQWGSLSCVALITSSVSVLGDLTESLFKRHENLKDSSHLIPGHGGVMDRVDSLVAAAPIYVLLLGVIGWL